MINRMKRILRYDVRGWNLTCSPEKCCLERVSRKPICDWLEVSLWCPMTDCCSMQVDEQEESGGLPGPTGMKVTYSVSPRNFSSRGAK